MADKNPWTNLSSKHIYENPWISLTEHQVLNPAGGPGIYGLMHFKNMAIGVLTLDEAMNITLVGQYRYPIEQYSWEIPEGGGLLGTDPLDGAKRELLEETGLKAERWDELMRMHLSNSVSDEAAYIYLARELSQHQACPEDTEELRIWTLPFEAAYQMVCRSEITDSMSVAAILRLKIMISENALPL